MIQNKNKINTYIYIDNNKLNSDNIYIYNISIQTYTPICVYTYKHI